MGFLTRCKRPFLFAFLLQFCNMLFSFFLKSFLILFEKQHTDYVHEQQSRYRTALADLTQRINGTSATERVQLNKRISSLQDQATEIHGFEEKIHHLADQMIKIDLDSGVKVNYEIFNDVLAKIK